MKLSGSHLRLVIALIVASMLMAIFMWKELPAREVRAMAALDLRARGVPKIWVNTVKSATKLSLAITGEFDVIDATGHITPQTNPNLGAVDVRAHGGGISIAGSPLDSPVIELHPKGDTQIILEDIRLPGAVIFTRNGDNSEITAGIELDIEEYTAIALGKTARLKGGSSEALLAEAVAIRTDVLYREAVLKLTEEDGRQFIDEPMLDAIRKGVHLRAQILAAVNLTRGIVLTWDYSVFPSLTTTSCGGHTENATHYFTTQNIMPLGGVVCPYCLLPSNKDANWNVRLSTKLISSKLAPFISREIYRKETVRSLEIIKATEQGRAVIIRISTAYGDFEIDAPTLVNILGEHLPAAPNTIKLTGKTKIEFTGKGRGDGVGLCRFGAQMLARGGKTFDAILSTYFPGARLAKLKYAKNGDDN